jgi:hypothetical protein
MPGRILLRTTPDGSQAPVDAVKIDSAQNVTVSAGNLVIGTSGKGIDFSATPGTGTSELLSDYEEGTWTPVFKATGTNLSSVTYASQTGNYTKIGRQVTVNAVLRTSAITIGAATGVVVIDGLPFTAASAGTGIVSNAFGWAGDFPIAGITENNFIYLNYRTSVNGRDFGIEPADLGLGANSNDMVVSVTYFV